MRLKTYHGESVKTVLQTVRRELGEDAFIISTLENENGVKITAAIEREHDQDPHLSITNDQSPIFKGDTLYQILKYHGLHDEDLKMLAESLTKQDTYFNQNEEVLNTIFSFRTLPFGDFTKKTTPPLMVVGTPGSGKTVALAKLTMQALLSGHFVNVITCDTYKSGSVNQLKTYMNAMELKLNTALSMEELTKEVDSTPQGSIILIDTPGLNPQNHHEVCTSTQRIQNTNSLPLWVCAAGEHPVETLDQMEIFRKMGCHQMIISKVDLYRRLGGALAASLTPRLSLSGFSCSPLIADEIIFANSTSLSKILTKKDESNNDESLQQQKREFL